MSLIVPYVSFVLALNSPAIITPIMITKKGLPIGQSLMLRGATPNKKLKRFNTYLNMWRTVL